MKSNRRIPARKLLVVSLLLLVVAAGGASSIPLTNCGPFTDVGTLLCPFVLELYYSGITAGTTSTTFSPNNNATRGQMAVFVAASLDRSLQRSSRRAALNQWWTTTPQYANGLGVSSVGTAPALLQSDGADVWVAVDGSQTVVRVRASDGTVLGTWTGAPYAYGVLVAMGRIFVSGSTSPGQGLYMIDPTQPPGPVTPVPTTAALGDYPYAMAFDGSRIWIACSNAVSIVTPGASFPWALTNVTSGFTGPNGIIFDGSNMWVTDAGSNQLFKLDASGNILAAVPVGNGPVYPIFDGHNIWVPNALDNSVSVVSTLTATVLTSLTGNGLNRPSAIGFDGQRILVANSLGDSVSLWKAANLEPIGSFSTGSGSFPAGVCSDGLNFWITLSGHGTVGRF
jgi:hypothetical protein